MTGRCLRGGDCDEDGLVAYMRPMLVFGHNVRPARICDAHQAWGLTGTMETGCNGAYV